MARTRVAVLQGARACLIRHGSKTTMVDIATASGVAKATLYNHFRTKAEVFAALVDFEIETAAAETRELAVASGAAVALARLGERLGEHPVVRSLAAGEPGVLAVLLLPERAGGSAGWSLAREAVTELVGPAAEPEIVLRYLVSQLLWPAPRVELEAAVRLLLPAGTAEEPATPVISPAGPQPEAAVVPGGAGPAVVPGGAVPGLGYPRGPSGSTDRIDVTAPPAGVASG